MLFVVVLNMGDSSDGSNLEDSVITETKTKKKTQCDTYIRDAQYSCTPFVYYPWVPDG